MLGRHKRRGAKAKELKRQLFENAMTSERKSSQKYTPKESRPINNYKCPATSVDGMGKVRVTEDGKVKVLVSVVGMGNLCAPHDDYICWENIHQSEFIARC